MAQIDLLVHAITKVLPFKHTYGVNPVIPGDRTNPHLFDLTTADDFAAHHLQQMAEIDEIRNRAFGLQGQAAEDMRTRHEDNNVIDEQKCKAGDIVLVRNFGKRKYEQYFYGPLEVVRATSLHIYQLGWGYG
ncbi:hypothetical protein BGZ58_010655 [Dissophora ornata]|nr:hypothetical protein BGZ58_010655 [Dissophora ornata]